MISVLGLITVNGKDVLEVDGNPSTDGGVAANRGSLAMLDSGTVGQLYIKTGAADTAWSLVDASDGDWHVTGNTLTGGSAVTPDQKFGSLNDYDVKFVRNNTELMRLFDGGLLVGLDATLGGRLQVAAGALGDELLKQISPNGGSGAKVINVTRQYKVQTTDATPTVLASLLVPASSRMLVNYRVGGNQHSGAGGTVGDGACYERTISTKRLAAGSAVLGKVQTDFTHEDVGSFNVTLAVNTNNIDLSVVGGATRNMAWSCFVEIAIYQD